MQIETFNHAESTGDAQEKRARSYEPAFAEKKKFLNSKFGANLFLTHLNGDNILLSMAIGKNQDNQHIKKTQHENDLTKK
jgi:hypothetical protein